MLEAGGRGRSGNAVRDGQWCLREVKKGHTGRVPPVCPLSSAERIGGGEESKASGVRNASREGHQ